MHINQKNNRCHQQDKQNSSQPWPDDLGDGRRWIHVGPFTVHPNVDDTSVPLTQHSSGGSILASFRSATDGPLKDARVLDVVRSQAQSEKLKDAGIEAIVLDIRNAVKVGELLAEYQGRCNPDIAGLGGGRMYVASLWLTQVLTVDMVINAAIGFDLSIPPAFIEALGLRKREAGREVWSSR